MATIITDSNLDVIAEGPVIAVHQSDDLLSSMDEWNTRTHNETGLVERVKTSAHTERGAEQETLEFIQQFVPKKRSPLCGNSICQDRRFLYRYMPKLEAWLHYRNLGREFHQGTGQPLAPGYQRYIYKAQYASRPGRYSGIYPGTAPLSGIFFQNGRC